MWRMAKVRIERISFVVEPKLFAPNLLRQILFVVLSVALLCCGSIKHLRDFDLVFKG